MYTQFFGLKEKPFAITPDPRFLFMSERHAEALAHLMYGINEAGGFVQLTGEIGAGKTTLVRALLEQMPRHADVAVILNPRITSHELLLSICQEIGVAVDQGAGSKALVDALNAHLLAAHAKGRRVVVIVDEAQNLSADTLEQVRLLTNLETASTKLLQIILIGQPELREILAGSGLRQLAQRITGRYHLEPLTKVETLAYVKHRLKIAGATGEIFSERALREVHRVSHGVPRVINVVCDRALLGAYSEDRHRIDAVFVRRAASEVFGHTLTPAWIPWAGGVTATIAVAVLAFAAVRIFDGESAAATAVAPPSTPAVVSTQPDPQPQPSAVDAGSILAGNTQTAAGDAAFSALLALWGAKLETGSDRPCDQAAKQGLECVYQKGSWGQLRMLNRPAILSLTDDSGTSHRAVLVKLADDTAHIDLGGGAQTVTIASLSRYWLGDYLLVWRPQSLGQSLGQRSLTLGMQGSEIGSLRKNLGALHAEAMRGASVDYFDEELARHVETFQREHRLTVDGIAGVQTQIVLDSVVNSGKAPRLLEEVEHQERVTVDSGRQSS